MPHPPPIAEACTDFEELLRRIAPGITPSRVDAARWSLCRTQLLGNAPHGAMPGFVIQCASIDRYRDFITLYHPALPARLALIEQAMATIRAVHAVTPADTPPPEEPDRTTGVPHWSF